MSTLQEGYGSILGPLFHKLEDHVRQCIRKVLEMGSSRKQRIRELEQRTIGGLEMNT